MPQQDLELLAPLFRWHPFPPGDPGPEVYLIFRDLDRQRQVQIVTALQTARTQIAEISSRAQAQIADVTNHANKQIGSILAQGGSAPKG